ncbi:MAG: transposase family protein [Sulfurimonas sp.]|nr:transposase family protein [Sulfurimonas sp.]
MKKLSTIVSKLNYNYANSNVKCPKPEIFNTDQGSQYTSKAHTDILKKHNIKISMDGKGRATNNICIERF